MITTMFHVSSDGIFVQLSCSKDAQSSADMRITSRTQVIIVWELLLFMLYIDFVHSSKMNNKRHGARHMLVKVHTTSKRRSRYRYTDDVVLITP